MAYNHFARLSKKWAKRHRKLQKELWEKHSDILAPHVEKLQLLPSQTIQNAPKQLMAGSLAGMLLLAQPAPTSLVAHSVDQMSNPTDSNGATTPHTREELKEKLAAVLPNTIQPLTDETKTQIGDVLTEFFHMPVSWQFGGKSLNRAYGYIGAEQHLMRYPGDTMATHFDNPDDAQKYYSSGMAPGRGAWGYFANSASEMTQEDVMREKYYIAVQTFLSPGFQENVREQYQFYKYRKMLVVNPENGKAVVAVIGDAGPAKWTGKQLGGSPEVMIHLERVDGSQKGPVLYYFIFDPENKIPLGPVEVS